jgi:hypothetical protein
MHPAQADFFDFNPALARRRLAAFFEGLAAALGIEQGKLTERGLASKQRPEILHGDQPPVNEAKHADAG